MKAIDFRLNVIVDAAAVPAGGLAESALAELALTAARNGATLIQYRDKLSEGGAMVDRARALRAALRGTGVPLVINDRVDIALAAQADGAHLGQGDIAPADARALLGPGAIIGLTLKTQAHVDMLAGMPVDYACIGGVFATAHKDTADPPLGLEGLAHLRAAVRHVHPNLPVGAIAGIDAGNAAAVMAAGVDGIAVIGAVLRAADPGAATLALRAIVDAALRRRLERAEA